MKSKDKDEGVLMMGWDMHSAELEQFIDMVRSGKSSLDIEDLTQPVYILNAIEKSLNEKREVALSEFDD